MKLKTQNSELRFEQWSFFNISLMQAVFAGNNIITPFFRATGKQRGRLTSTLGIHLTQAHPELQTCRWRSTPQQWPVQLLEGAKSPALCLYKVKMYNVYIKQTWHSIYNGITVTFFVWRDKHQVSMSPHVLIITLTVVAFCKKNQFGIVTDGHNVTATDHSVWCGHSLSTQKTRGERCSDELASAMLQPVCLATDNTAGAEGRESHYK